MAKAATKTKELTPAEKSQKSELARRQITKARISLLMKHPFLGNLAMHFGLVDATDAGWCPTMAVDGRKIYYNADFVLGLAVEQSGAPSELMFVFCHELLHCAFEHFGRRSLRDPDYWNMATDFIVNGFLEQEGIGKMPTEIVVDKTSATKGQQRVGLYDKRYCEPNLWTSEAVYDDLMKRKVKKQLTLDVHIPMAGSGDPEDGENPGGQSMPKINDTDLEEIREHIKSALISSASAAAGNMSAGLQRLLNNFLTPEINWRELLQSTINSCMSDDYTFMKPNRRFTGTNIFMPVLNVDETIDVQVAIDMSASISDKVARKFLTEVWEIMEVYSQFKIGVLCFDTNIHNYQEFTHENKQEFLGYECRGGGGTSFEAVWEYWQQNEILPKKAIWFTDGYPNYGWGPSDYCDTLWIIAGGHGSRIVPPFGAYAYIDLLADFD